MGIAPDKGLFMPVEIPRFADGELSQLQSLSYPEVASAVLYKFLEDTFSEEELKDICNDAYDFKVPMEDLNGDHLLRLDQGPTASFKDFAARFMARAMSRLRGEREYAVLVATSGDTGSAIGEAYKDLDGFKVLILYPRDEVSTVQKHLLDTIGGNVYAYSVEGKFDDCQRIVKDAFLDGRMKPLNPTAANSINISRVLPQIVYYVYAYGRVATYPEPVVFSVPSGNFGSSLGCELARRMGLPVRKLLIATNENDEFPRYLRYGEYEPVVPSRKCISNAMNVGNPSNLARYFDLYGGTLDKDGVVHSQPDIDQMRENLYSISITDEQTIDTIKRWYEKGVLLEPHGAVGVAALERYRDETGDSTKAICLETAHPGKFPEVIRQELGIEPEKSEHLRVREALEGESLEMPADQDIIIEDMVRTIKKGVLK